MDHTAADRTFAFGARKYLSLTPTEYFQRNVWLGATLISRPELDMRHLIGVKRLMWGSDYPHLESHWPHTREKLRDVMKGIAEDEVRAMVGGNAVDAYSLDVDELMPVVKRVGPAAREIVSE
jgi:predicted TIM-barrel fold metal-dependent hydrolase